MEFDDIINIKANKKSALILIMSSIIAFLGNALYINLESINDLNIIENTKLYSINSYKSGDENIVNSNQLKRTNDKLSLLNFNVTRSGLITGDLFFEN